MCVIPKELIYKNRHDIDTYLSEPGLNSKLYDLLLDLREATTIRKALSVKPITILNDAYGQALRVIIDKHPEDNYVSKFFDNEAIYLKDLHEVELVFCIVHTLLRFSMIRTPNVMRFLHLMELKMKNNIAYAPDVMRFEESIANSLDYQPERDRFYLKTDEITKDDLKFIDWNLVTSGYSENGIKRFLNFAVDLDYQLAILDAIKNEYEFNCILAGNNEFELNTLFEKMETTCREYKTIMTPLPVVDSSLEDKEEITKHDSAFSNELKQLREENARLRELTNSSVKKELLQILQTQEKAQACSSVESKFRITSRKNTDVIKIISAMFDMKLFSTSDGKLASNKQEVMENFGRLLGADFSNYSASLSAAKNTANFMKTFEELFKVAEEYYNT